MEIPLCTLIQHLASAAAFELYISGRITDAGPKLPQVCVCANLCVAPHVFSDSIYMICFSTAPAVVCCLLWPLV